MPTTRVDARHAALASAMLLLVACGGGNGEPPPARSYADVGYVDAGGFRLHYALTQTTDLPSEIAGSYGIVQRSNLALLTIALARHDAAPGTTWLALVGIRDREAVTIEIRARAAAGPDIEARFTRMFHLD